MAPTGRAAVFHGPGKPFEIRELPLPEVEPDAILIRITVANICGSDLHFWRGDAPLRLPEDGWIYGHEMTGRVARLGARVKTDSLGRPLTEGDRVAYCYFYPCGRCHACLALEPAACPNKVGRPLGPSHFPHFHGAFAEYYYLRPGGAVFAVPAVVPEGLEMLRTGGTYLEIGTISRGVGVELEPAQLVWGSKKIIGVVMYDPWVIPQALDFLVRSRERVPFDRLISQKFPLEEIDAAFRASEWISGETNITRAALVP